MESLANQLKNTTVIIPAAGFGRRVQPLRDDQAKELFNHPNKNLPLIQVAIERCNKIGFKPHIITRKNKSELIGWLQKSYPDISLQLIDSSKEWADTVLQSESYWSEKNLILLPDTDFEPENVLTEMNKNLDFSEFVFGTFSSINLSTWGVVQQVEAKTEIIEKPTHWRKSAKPWGIIGFKKLNGNALFSAVLKSHVTKDWQSLFGHSSFIELASFQDFTR